MTSQTSRPAEQHYRAAIIALREGRWEQAGNHLLAVVTDSPGYRDASDVLLQLERTRPVAYWRAAFTFAMEQGALSHAQAAIEKLSQLDPAQSDLPEMRERLASSRLPGWHRPTGSPSPATAPPPEAEAEEADSGLPPLDEGESPGAGFEAPQSDGGDWIQDDVPEARDGPAAPRPDSLPEEPGLLAAWEAGNTPREPISLAQLLNVDVAGEPHRALKTTLFGEPPPGMNISAGPVYNALGEPRALKTASFLEETQPQQAQEPEPQPSSAPDDWLPEAPEVEHRAPADQDEDTQPNPAITLSSPQAAGDSVPDDEWPT